MPPKLCTAVSLEPQQPAYASISKLYRAGNGYWPLGVGEANHRAIDVASCIERGQNTGSKPWYTPPTAVSSHVPSGSERGMEG